MASTIQTDCALTPEQVAFYDDNGYLILRKWITGRLLERLQDAASRWIETGLTLSPEDPARRTSSTASEKPARCCSGWTTFHDKGQPPSLEMLGAPQVLGVVQSLTGPQLRADLRVHGLQEEGDGEAIRWHQDAVHPRRHRIYNYDLYLDRSSADGGALVVLPKSHTTKVDACELERMHGWSPPNALVVEMEPGDVLVHDVMVVHGSPRVVGKALRRTIYYEFRPAEQILAEGPWDREWVDRRMRLIPIALAAHREAFPESPQFDWNPDPDFRQTISPDMERELKIAHVVHTPGSHCSAGSVHM